MKKQLLGILVTSTLLFAENSIAQGPAYFTETFENVSVTSVGNPAQLETVNVSNREWKFYASHKQTKNYTGSVYWESANPNPSIKVFNYSASNQTTYGTTTQSYIISPVFSQGISQVSFNEINRATLNANAIKIYTSEDGGQTWSSGFIGNAAKATQFALLTVAIESASINRLKIVNDNGTDLNFDNLTIYAPVGTVLPLDFLSFNAKLTDGISKQVKLSWSTANEVNTKSFAIERKTSAGFATIGSIASNNTAGTSNYSFTDIAPATGVNYYRIKQIDKDGKSSAPSCHPSPLLILQDFQ